MKFTKIKNTNITAPGVVLGCMHLNELSKKDVKAHIEKAMELGVNFFDHSDIYGKGECETIFSDALGMNAGLREQMVIQSKCGIREVGYDFSRSHILQAVEGSLRRLKTDYLDALLLHRPDTLMEPDEIAEAFDKLHAQGKVRYFGVSNQNPMQMELIQKAVNQKLVFNQLQLSMAYTPMIDTGITVNMMIDQSVERAGSILEYCRLKDVAIQAWSPFQYGFFEGVFIGNKKYPELNKKINALAKKYHSTPNGIAIAWLLRHPAITQVVIGTTKQQRLAECAQGADAVLTREEWYEVYAAAGNRIP